MTITRQVGSQHFARGIPIDAVTDSQTFLKHSEIPWSTARGMTPHSEGFLDADDFMAFRDEEDHPYVLAVTGASPSFMGRRDYHGAHTRAQEQLDASGASFLHMPKIGFDYT